MRGESAPAEGAAERRFFRIWILIFAVVFVALLLSTLRFLLSEHLPARFLDVERSVYERSPSGGARLHLVVLHVPEEGQLLYRVVPRVEGGDWRVEVDWTAETKRPAGRPSGGGERVLDIPLPEARPEVVVIDRRWATEEALRIPLAPGDAP